MSWQKSLLPRSANLLSSERTARENYRVLIETVFLEFKKLPLQKELADFIRDHNASLLPGIKKVPLGSSTAAADARDAFIAELAEERRSSIPAHLLRRFETLAVEVAGHVKRKGALPSPTKGDAS